MQHDCKIGLVQMEAFVGETERNLCTIFDAADKAAKKGVQFLCFPEMALQGYSPADAKALAEPIDGRKIKQIVQCAQDLNMVLLVGMAEHAGNHETKPYLSQLIAMPEGEIGVYRKTHLGHNEGEYFSAGQTFPVFKSQGLTFAVGICWDWHFPEMATIYSLKGAELLFAPHASPRVAGDRKALWLRYLGARAYDNSVYLAACNLSGRNGRGQSFSGGALVIGPKAEILGESQEGEDLLVTSDLSAERINRLREHHASSMKERFFLLDRRREIYQELLELEASPF